MHGFSQGFFELALGQNPRPQTVAISGADAEFSKVSTDGAQFAAAAFMDRMICSGSLSLARARFHGPVCLRNTACYGGLWCEGAQFFSSVDTRGLEIHGRNLTAGTKLEQKVPPASV